MNCKWLCKGGTLFLIGAVTYYLIELAWRFSTGNLPSHWSMAILGGAMFLVVGEINEVLAWETPLITQALIGGGLITGVELLAGLVLNVCLGLSIWDYSMLPFNILGQVCAPFFLAWVGLSVVAIVLDDWLRYWLFAEERPHYHMLRAPKTPVED